jgi:hypothetical protein
LAAPVGSCKLKLGVEKRAAEKISLTVIRDGESTTDGACHERMSVKPALIAGGAAGYGPKGVSSGAAVTDRSERYRSARGPPEER